jgi:hypothetical protein
LFSSLPRTTFYNVNLIIGMCDPFDLNACNFPRGTCAKDGFCNCDVGFFGDYCQFPEICDDEPGRFIRVNPSWIFTSQA